MKLVDAACAARASTTVIWFISLVAESDARTLTKIFAVDDFWPSLWMKRHRLVRVFD